MSKRSIQANKIFISFIPSFLKEREYFGTIACRIQKRFFICFLAWVVWFFFSFFSTTGFTSSITVVRQSVPSYISVARKSENDRVPALCSFQAPILDKRHKIVYRLKIDDLLRIKAQEVVSQNLAKQGILRTLARVMNEFPELPYRLNGRANKKLLEEIGIPIRLLTCYYCRNPKIAGLNQIIEAIEKKSFERSPESMDAFLGEWEFSFIPTLPGFQILPENGVYRIEAIRMQLPTLEYVKGVGDGCAIDIMHQFLMNSQHIKFFISLPPSDLESCSKLIDQWKVPLPERVFLLEDENVYSQWAQDNCKTGILFNVLRKSQEYITLVPRFASVGDGDSEYRPSESFIFDQIQRAGWCVVQSPLLFQGGNLLPIKNPETGKCILFVGQAEIGRNMKLGLKEEEVLDAFCREFGVDRIEVLPQPSFHIDLEVSFRWHEGKIIAFLNDSPSASRLIIKCGIKGLYYCGVLSEIEADQLIHCLEYSVQEDRLVKTIWDKINEFCDQNDHSVREGDDLFIISGEESGGINVTRFLNALDIFTALHRDGVIFWEKLTDNPNKEGFFTYYRNLLDKEFQRLQLKSRLLSMGIEISLLPSTSDGEASLNYINAVHDLNAVYLPAFGGMFREIDKKVFQIVKNSLGHKVEVHLIRNSMTQSQSGGVHCSVSVYGR